MQIQVDAWVLCMKRSTLVNSRDVAPCIVVVAICRSTLSAISHIRYKGSSATVCTGKVAVGTRQRRRCQCSKGGCTVPALLKSSTLICIASIYFCNKQLSIDPFDFRIRTKGPPPPNNSDSPEAGGVQLTHQKSPSKTTLTV